MLQRLLITSLLALTTAVAAPNQPFKKAVCNADNCLRAVRASSSVVKQPQASQDCQSYFASTSHSAVLPTYAASVCSNSARYYSACSCAGYLGSYSTTSTNAASPTTATSPTTTSVVTTTTTSASLTTTILSTISSATSDPSLTTITPSSTTTSYAGPPPCSTLALQAASGPFAGQYLLSDPNYSSSFGVSTPIALEDSRYLYEYQPENGGSLLGQKFYILTSRAGTSPVNLVRYSNVPAYTPGPPTDYDSGPHGLFCSISLQPPSSDTNGMPGYGGPVTCQGWTGNQYAPVVFQVCPSDPNLDHPSELLVDTAVATALDSSCQAIDIIAKAVCRSNK